MDEHRILLDLMVKRIWLGPPEQTRSMYFDWFHKHFPYPPYTNFSRGKCLIHTVTEGKGDHSNLHEDVKLFFDGCLKEDFKDTPHGFYETVDGEHLTYWFFERNQDDKSLFLFSPSGILQKGMHKSYNLFLNRLPGF